MKVLMYGAEICPGCVKAKELLSTRPDIELDYRNITESTARLKEFLAYRDHDTMFAEVIKEGRIGIPFFILEDGTKTFQVSDILDTEIGESKEMNAPVQTETNVEVNACSLDGKGKC
jgi:glutaredoxin-related protein